MTDRADAKPSKSSKAERYERLGEEIAAVLEGEDSLTARMASVAAMLAAEFETFLWTGFYVVDPLKSEELVIGPYQGTLGCLRIAFGRGVCGTAAREGRTLVVGDVAAFPGHIACDSRSRSEIVTPVRNAERALIAVLDVDSAEPDAFDKDDAAGLEAIVARTFGR
jgi:GAF domain-containing protein